MLSGGSFVSRSLTWLAKTVTVHCSLLKKSVSGLSVKTEGPPVTVAVWKPLWVQEIWNQLPETLTASSTLTMMLEERAAFVPPLAGVVLKTSGASSPGGQTLGVENLLRGSGTPAVKLAAL